jgi:hypothetical protein
VVILRGMDDLDRIITGALNHGLAEEPEHETGDLVQVLRSCWSKLTPGQRQEVLAENHDVLGWVFGACEGGEGAPGEDGSFVDGYEREIDEGAE